MADAPRSENPKDPVVTTSLGIVAVHLLWLIVGPFTLASLLWGIFRSGGGWLTGLDLGLLVAVCAMLCARWIEQRSGQAVTIYGEPSTWADFHRYARILPALGLAAWIVANAVGQYVYSWAARGG